MFFWIVYSFGFSAALFSAESVNHFGSSEGTFVLLYAESGEIKKVNSKFAEQPLSPCSTFKVPNSVFGLESGHITGEKFTLKFDPQKTPKKKFWPNTWAQDHDLASAIKNSVVWYYQEVARRIGITKMSQYLKTSGFGNADASGGIDRFWLSSSLKISPVEQVKYWHKLFSHQLSFKKKNVDLVKALIEVERTVDYTLYAKTGTCVTSKRGVGAWWVGLVEKNGKSYYFATHFAATDFKQIQSDRVRISKSYLKDFGIL